jgi:hypothetical protein
MPKVTMKLSDALIPFLLIAVMHDISEAGLITYTDRSDFDAAVSGAVTLLNFDSVTVGNLPSGSSIDGIDFVYDFGGISLNVTNVFDTTSSPNFLGTDDGDLLQDGDDIAFSFSLRSGFGLYIISADGLLDGDLQLTVGTTTVALESSAVQATLPDSSNVWFLGILANDLTTFAHATLTTHGGGGAFLYNLDDIVTSSDVASTVPEPSSLVLFSLVTVGLAAYGARKRNC